MSEHGSGGEFTPELLRGVRIVKGRDKLQMSPYLYNVLARNGWEIKEGAAKFIDAEALAEVSDDELNNLGHVGLGEGSIKAMRELLGRLAEARVNGII